MKKNIKIITLLTLWFLTISSVFAFQFFWKNKISETTKNHVCTSNGLWLEAIPWLLWLDYDWNSSERTTDLNKNICIIKNFKWEQFYINLDYLYHTIVWINNLILEDGSIYPNDGLAEKWKIFWNSLKNEFKNEVWILKD